MADKPTIGITMGDPCGVGAEIIVRALGQPQLRARAKFVVFGFSNQIEYTADQLEVHLPFHRDHHENLRRYIHDLVVLDYDEFDLPPAMPRGPSFRGGKASMAFCQGAIDAALAGQIDAMVTAPISKTSWCLAGHKQYPGHTELLAKKTQSRHVAMMFVAPKLRVALATIHDSIVGIRDKFTIGCVYNPIELADKALREWFGIEKPRIGVCGLNPHAGENGNIGDEEARIIAPAVLMATENGIDATGPFPADTIYNRALDDEFDIVIAMYHDQGLIPIKLLGWEDAVNVTLGLPIIRTSPDHGTAFDIAGQLKANPASLVAAINLAIDLAEKKK
jgi:4-phospho-D-threonate 3-dehydrogenase / 4-phospho-D-erythronate 3-dehydrogenase